MTSLPTFHRNLIIGATVACVIGFGQAVADEPADLNNGVATTNADTVVGVNQNVIDKISNDYHTFLGDNADAVVTGLRTGNEITLTTTGPGGTTTTNFTPPTGKMGYGNVSHSLGLAQEQLRQYGITEPTADELQAALVGGDITAKSGGVETLDGVLTLRSEGMGWGEIAHEYGVKLGHVVSSVKSEKQHTLVTTHDQAETTTEATGNQMKISGNTSKAYGKGIVTGSGTSATAGTKPDKIKTSQGKSRAYGRGIVSAAGSSVGSGNSSKTIMNDSTGKNGHAYGHGVITAAGSSASSAGIASRTKGKGLAKGHTK